MEVEFEQAIASIADDIFIAERDFFKNKISNKSSMSNTIKSNNDDDLYNKIVFNTNGVVINWKDNTTTRIKNKDKSYDYEKLLALCFAKKFCGNGDYFNNLIKRISL